MRNVATAALALLTFASGAASGFFIGRCESAHRAGELPTRREMIDALAREAQLDARQRADVERIADANHERFVAVRARVEPELAAIRSDVRAQMRRLLDEKQAARFDAYFDRLDRERAALQAERSR